MKKILSVGVLIISILITGCVELSKTNVVSDNSSIQYQEDSIYNNYMLNPEYSIFDNESAYIFDENIDGSYSLKYVDFEKQMVTYLCNQLSCSHNSDSCTSYVPANIGGSYLAKTPNKIVLLTVGNTINIPPSIITMSHNGSDRKVLAEFNISQQITAPYVLGEDSIYIVLRSAYKDSTGLIKMKKELVKIDLYSGDITIITDLKESQELIGVKDNRFLLKEYDNGIERIVVLSQDGKDTSVIYEYKAGTGMRIELYNKIYLLNYGDKKLQCIENDGIIDIANLPFEGSMTTTFLRSINGSKVILDNSTFDSKKYSYNTTRYCIDFNTGEFTTNDFVVDRDGRKNNMRVYAFTDEYVLATVAYEYAEHIGEIKQTGERYIYKTEDAVYGIFSTEDFLNNNLEYKILEKI